MCEKKIFMSYNLRRIIYAENEIWENIMQENRENFTEEFQKQMRECIEDILSY